MAILQIDAVENLSPGSAGLWGGWVDQPQPPLEAERHDFELSGWVVGKGTRAVAIEIVLDDPVLRNSPYWLPTIIQTVPVNHDRPDVAGMFPQEPHGLRCAFRCMISTVGLPQGFQLLLRAVLANNKRSPMAAIRGSRQAIESGCRPRLQPLIVTFLGRTGSTWMMRLLAEHRSIIAHGGYPYEAQPAAYWAHLLQVLTRSPEHYQSLHLRGCLTQPNWVGPNPFYTLPDVEEPRLHEWFAGSHPGMVVEFSQRSIDSFYEQVAHRPGAEEAVFFMEKWGLGSPHELLAELFPGMKEIILVRDPRDVICSVRSFNERRGFEHFGRQFFQSDEEYIDGQGIVMRQLLHRWRAQRERAHLVRYEDLIRRPDETLRGVLRYLELEASPETTRGMIERASVDPSLKGHLTAADPAASIGRWRRELNDDLQSRCAEAFREVLQAFDYR